METPYAPQRRVRARRRVRRDVHDHTAAVQHHRSCHHLREAERTHEVHRQGALQVLAVGVEQQAQRHGPEGAGVVDQHVDVPTSAAAAPAIAVDGALVADVLRERVRLASRCADARDRLLQRLSVTGDQHDTRPPRRELRAEGGTQPPAASGHDRSSSSNVHDHHLSLTTLRPAGPKVGAGDNPLEERYSLGMDADLGARLGQNLKQLREARGATQAQMAKLADLPRATWANLESGASNPTLSVLDRVATALQVTLEELIATPSASAQRYPRGTLPVKQRGNATIYKLLPEAVAGMEIDRIELPPGARMTGIPHTPGTTRIPHVRDGRGAAGRGGRAVRAVGGGRGRVPRRSTALVREPGIARGRGVLRRGAGAGCGRKVSASRAQSSSPAKSFSLAPTSAGRMPRRAIMRCRKRRLTPARSAARVTLPPLLRQDVTQVDALEALDPGLARLLEGQSQRDHAVDRRQASCGRRARRTRRLRFDQAQRDAALDEVAQLAHVARPAARREAREEVGRELGGARRRRARGRSVARAAGMSSRRVRSGRQGERHDREAVVEVLAEGAVVDAAGEGAVGRGDDAHVDRHGWSRCPRAAPCATRWRAGASAAARRGISPISSRKSVPPWASSKTPLRSEIAPVKAPRTCPNSSLSTRFSGMAPQSTATKGPSARGEAACSERARTSLPVPVSPSTSTVASVAATRSRTA